MRRKRLRASLETAIVDVCGRELGLIPTKRFANRIAASKDLVLRLDVYRKLERHRGCVNTVSFSDDGDLLVSGSDDRRVIIWDWQTGGVKFSFHSGHINNVFQAKIMPYTEDRSIVTCAADGQVRHAQLLERGKVTTTLLGKHQGRVHKLAIEPASPHIFYTCGEDGLVQHFDLRTPFGISLFTCQYLAHQGLMPFVSLNTIAIDPRSPNLFAVGGSDECARLYDIRKYRSNGSTDFGMPVDYFCASHLIGKELVSITGLAFSDQSELLVSYSEEFIYLFTKEMGLGPDLPEACKVSVSNASSSKMDADLIDESRGLAQATSETKGIVTEKDRQTTASLSEMNVDLENEPQVYKGHTNFETVKGVSFFGPKCEYIISGSDCGRVFIWEKKGGELIRVMEADKHIVNCIESHPHTTVLASCGIENNVKIWTPKAHNKATLPTNVEKVLKPPRLESFPRMDDVDEFYFEYDNDDSDEDNSGEGDDSYESSSDNDEGDDSSVESSDHDGCDDSSDGFSYYDIDEIEEGTDDGDDNVSDR